MTMSYVPVVSAARPDYEGRALVGTYSAVIGWTLNDPAQRAGLRGFAIRRTDMDPATNEVMRLQWLRGYKRFKEDDDGQAGDISSLRAPFQRFRWNDYTLSASRVYRYEVFPMRGDPGALTREEPPLSFEVRPSVEDPGDLGVFVNRGVTAAMAYLARFKERPPSEVGEPAYAWLSRGLKESLMGLVRSANPGDALHVAIYEFHDHDVASALKEAHDRGVTVRIVHDAKGGKRSTEKSLKVVADHDLGTLTTHRTKVNISHNKIVIRLVGGVPTEVWTGSANFSENAFNFQTNTALIIRDAGAAQNYEDYFQTLTDNAAKAASKDRNRAIVDRINGVANRFADQTYFSPLRTRDILDASVALIESARSAVLISAPFGLDQAMVDALHANSRDIIEYGLVNATARSRIETLHRRNTRFFTPNRLKTFMGRKWDSKAFGAHKIHAKTIVIDPWSDNPQILIGSANFSKASCMDNDENALVINGNRRLSAIVATEFMRMYDHYKSRFYIDQQNDENKLIKKGNKTREAQGLDPLPLKAFDVHLKGDDGWSRTAFDNNSPSHKFRDRIVFAGG